MDALKQKLEKLNEKEKKPYLSSLVNRLTTDLIDSAESDGDKNILRYIKRTTEWLLGLYDQGRISHEDLIGYIPRIKRSPDEIINEIHLMTDAHLKFFYKPPTF